MAGRFTISFRCRALGNRRPLERGLGSAVSGYELVNKHRLGELLPPLAEELSIMIRRAALPVLAISFEHAVAAAELPGPHRDPWDRLLMAQATIGQLTLISVDNIFGVYGIATVW